jgi:hypothetical protein
MEMILYYRRISLAILEKFSSRENFSTREIIIIENSIIKTLFPKVIVVPKLH